MVKDLLNKLAAGNDLLLEETAQFINLVAAGETSDAQVAAFLTGLRIKGEKSAEIAGCVRALRQHAVALPHHQELVFDCCGTGGDGSNSFNISTAAAIVIAACGVPVAKHGNRAVSSACGSADILEEAGAKIEIRPEHSAKMLDEIGFCFLFAPLYHPVAAKVAKVRRELGFRTLFNLLGPLLNPARATHQMIGTSSEVNARQIAAVAEYLPSLNIITYYNSHGCDEILPGGVNLSFQWSSGNLRSRPLLLPRALENHFKLGSIKGGDRKRNLEILQSVFEGHDSTAMHVTALNAAFGLLFAKKVEDVDLGYEMAIDALRSAKAERLFEQYIALSNEAI